MSPTNPPPPASLSGVRVDLGVRAGAEVHFGFLGLPQLAIEGSVGLSFSYQSVGAAVGSASHSESSLLFATGNTGSPWDLLRTQVAARYYF